MEKQTISVQIPCDWVENPIPTPVFDSYMKTLTNGRIKHCLTRCMPNGKGLYIRLFMRFGM